ncbi:Detected protein of unknown function [Hibiscus syriacus]|uniref:Peptidase A1 domain-containing protein n=1 Tax=Hibiscus syriacus TaxID=106335 RepID=A0A6A2WJF2_HIBSY|nr:Detected protein of unknown function [Hibiscus syriacus]
MTAENQWLKQRRRFVSVLNLFIVIHHFLLSTVHFSPCLYLNFVSQKATFPLSIFGCGHDNQVIFGPENPGIAGLVGLGGGNFSLVSQIRTQVDHRFSYCFVPLSAKPSGKLFFGQESIISRPGVVSIPLVSKFPETYYYLTLEGVSIGDKTVRSSLGQGNIVIDSGTTMTYLEQDLYNGLVAMVKEVFREEPVQDPSSMSRLCFRTDNNINVPEMRSISLVLTFDCNL